MHKTTLVLMALLTAATATAAPPQQSNAGGVPACQKELGSALEQLKAAQAEVAALSAKLEATELSDALSALIRLRKRPDLLTAEWNELLDDSISNLRDNPLATKAADPQAEQDMDTLLQLLEREPALKELLYSAIKRLEAGGTLTEKAP